MRKLLFLLFTIAILTRCEQNKPAMATKEVTEFKDTTPRIEPIWRILDVTYTSRSEIEKVFGKPTKVTENPADDAGIKGVDLELQFKGDITILFKKDHAVWFDFEKLENIKWSDRLAAFGLPEEHPIQTLSDGTEWYKPSMKIKNISFTPSKTKPGYVRWAIVTVL